jgi:hypothetical protein
MNDDQIARTMAEEIADLVIKGRPMELVCHPLTVFQLTGLIQLALRHPGVTPELRETAERFLVGVREYFADCPTVLAVVRRGDDPAEDLRVCATCNGSGRVLGDPQVRCRRCGGTGRTVEDV